MTRMQRGAFESRTLVRGEECKRRSDGGRLRQVTAAVFWWIRRVQAARSHGVLVLGGSDDERDKWKGLVK
jgi:hypothetical protein